MIADTYATHEHEKVRRRLQPYPRFHVRFTPTSSSWLNMVERFFRDLTLNRLRRGVFRDVKKPIAAIGDDIDRHNESLIPLIKTAKASDILEKVEPARGLLEIGQSVWRSTLAPKIPPPNLSIFSANISCRRAPMKRWWNYSPRQPRRRVVRVLAPAMMAGAACLAVSNLPPIQFQATVARTSGAVVTAWAFGTLSEAQQPSSGDACDLRHVCELAISSNGGSGTGTGATIKNIVAPTPQTDPAPNLPFTLRETIDYRRPVSAELGSGGQGTCYPANGMITITADTSDVLVLDIMGQACQAGQTTDQFVLTGSYISDTTSTGQYANVDGIGNVSINTPSGIGTAVKNVKASFVGQLKYTP